MGRVLAIDFGTRRIGLAISDEMQVIASGLESISYKDISEVITKLKTLVEEKNVEKIVLGYPLSMSGKITRIGLLVLEFKKTLEEVLKIPVELLDERLTTEIAKQIQERVKRKPTPPKGLVDKISAILILQDYLQKTRKK
ncbi:MAG: Holliday junction resolvase RuvX [candidate division WOR-3 bacterium]|nr:Holliday junction resolvase RuvX [candidate division WOR-3 bacterium]MCX7757405.1 Holliday junction resolvase RuvX [candidate division WOR-3 bacterium]MDW7987883.1 Holliday junction resolvase RuvX [candidate division WOR-3 bacterium]